MSEVALFERFTNRGRRVVVLAQEQARLLNHGYIGTEHVLLGLIAEGEGVACKALDALDIKLDEVRRLVQEMINETTEPLPYHIPFTPRAKKVLELSLREALQLGHNYIGTEHILLGLTLTDEAEEDVLVKLGADLSRVRHMVIQLLSGGSPYKFDERDRALLDEQMWLGAEHERDIDHGVWLAYEDASDWRVFGEEIEALRYAVGHGMSVRFVRYGADPFSDD